MKILCYALLLPLFATTALSAQTTQQATHPYRVRGTVKSIDGDNLIVRTGRTTDDTQDVSIPIDESTIIDLDGDIVTSAELKPGMSIGTLEGPSFGGSAPKTRITASSPAISGTIVKVDGNQVVLNVAQRGQNAKEVNITTDDKTKVLMLGAVIGNNFKAGGQKTLADLQPDMRVRVIPTTGTATKILVAPPRPPRPASTQPGN